MINTQSKWDNTYMNIAKEYAAHSKCAAKHVACVIVKDNNIISIGINGTMPGRENCCDKFKKVEGQWYKCYNGVWRITDNDEHHEWSRINETHAEINALAKANNNGVSVVGSTAYITHSCCFDCAKALATFGVKRIVYDKEYDGILKVVAYLTKLDIEFVSMEEINAK